MMHMHISDILQDALLLCEDIDDRSDGQEGDNVQSRNSRAIIPRLGSQGRSLQYRHHHIRQEQNGPTDQ
jgi:hypothetical protein